MDQMCLRYMYKQLSQSRIQFPLFPLNPLSVVSLLDLYSLTLAWKQVVYLESWCSSSYRNVLVKSIFEKILQLHSFALMSSCLGIGRFVDWIALIMLLVSSITLSNPSVFGVTTVFDIHDAGLSEGSSSMTLFH